MAVSDFRAFKPDMRTGLDRSSLNNSHQSTMNLANLQAQKSTPPYETPEKQNFLFCIPLKKPKHTSACKPGLGSVHKTVKIHSLQRIWTHAWKCISGITPDEGPSTDAARTTSPACNLQTNFTVYTFPHWLVLRLTSLLWKLSTKLHNQYPTIFPFPVSLSATVIMDLFIPLHSIHHLSKWSHLSVMCGWQHKFLLSEVCFPCNYIIFC